MADPVVFFERPENWDDMTEAEQDEFAMSIAEQMGFEE